jgi:purine nucleosidase
MKLWFDTDPGVDDALAMALIAARTEFEWIGLSTVFGNASSAQTTSNALRLLERLGRDDVAVHAGADAPLVGSARYAAEVHGGDGLGGRADSLPAARREADSLPAAEAILRASREHRGLQLVAVGPLTNIAAALRLDPGLAERVGGLTVMGGAFGQQGQSGNVTPAAEANIHNDARAAAEVLAAPWSQCVRLKPAQIEPLREQGGLAQWLYGIVEPYMGFYGQYYGEPMLVAHDAIAVLPLLAPDAFHWRRGALRVVEGGLAHGQTLQDWQRLGDAAWQALPAHEVAVAADPEIISSLCLRAWLKA